MTLYNANNKSTGRPWPRIRIRGLPTQVAMPALGEGAKMGARGMRGGMNVADSAIKAATMGKLASTAHWSGAASFMHGWKGGGVLAIAPSAALDFYSSFEQDMSGDRRFNGNKFLVASAKSQSGNLLGWGLGGVAGVGAIAVGVTGAPVILIGLGIGFAVQAIWGWQGGSDWAASAAERALKP